MLSGFSGASIYPALQASAVTNDPWSLAPPAATPATTATDPWLSTHSATNATTTPFQAAPASVEENINSKQRGSTKTPESFLGENSSLVNLDNLLGTVNNGSKLGHFFG